MGIGKVFIRRALFLCEFFSHKRMAAKKKKKPGGCLVSSALTICMEISVKNFCQMVLVLFFLVPKKVLKCTICKIPAHFSPALVIQTFMVRKNGST